MNPDEITDTQRLDWLEANMKDRSLSPPSGPHSGWWLFHDDVARDTSGETLRHAIDEAMREGRGDKQ